MIQLYIGVPVALLTRAQCCAEARCSCSCSEAGCSGLVYSCVVLANISIMIWPRIPGHIPVVHRSYQTIAFAMAMERVSAFRCPCARGSGCFLYRAQQTKTAASFHLMPKPDAHDESDCTPERTFAR
jgi:hypothetical protein